MLKNLWRFLKIIKSLSLGLDSNILKNDSSLNIVWNFTIIWKSYYRDKFVFEESFFRRQILLFLVPGSFFSIILERFDFICGFGKYYQSCLKIPGQNKNSANLRKFSTSSLGVNLKKLESSKNRASSRITRKFPVRQKHLRRIPRTILDQGKLIMKRIFKVK